MRIRVAQETDAAALVAIYAPYVEHTAITFEYDVPSVEEFRGRIRHTLERYPYLVLEDEEKGEPVILGYAYAGPLKERAAYGWAVELSIYVREDCHGRGAGRQLYEALEKCLKAQGICNLYACIAVPPVDASGKRRNDETLDMNSVDFHSHLGYTTVGDFHACGYKFNRWYDMAWMGKMIGSHEEAKPIRKFDVGML